MLILQLQLGHLLRVQILEEFYIVSLQDYEVYDE